MFSFQDVLSSRSRQFPPTPTTTKVLSLPPGTEKVMDSSDNAVIELSQSTTEEAVENTSVTAVSEPVVSPSEESRHSITEEPSADITETASASQPPESPPSVTDPQTAALLTSLMEPGESCGTLENTVVESCSEPCGEQEEVAVTFSVSTLRERLATGGTSRGEEAIEGRTFLAKISPEENEKAEAELQRNFRCVLKC